MTAFNEQFINVPNQSVPETTRSQLPQVSMLPVTQPPVTSFNDQIVTKLTTAVNIVANLIHQTAGHDAYQCRKLAYYAVGTHFIQDYNVFSGLAIYGPPGTGKSDTIDVLKLTCDKVLAITGETVTKAALKECMKEAHLGTLVIEEADSVTSREIENILVTRYSKASADLKKMVADGKKWKLQASSAFGATICHRRNLFRDSAMLRRVITVQTKRKKGTYIKVTKETHSGLIAEYQRQFGFQPEWPQVTNEWDDVEPAIIDCYKPLIALAKLINDTEFLEALVNEMRKASSRLIKEEEYLDNQVLLKVLITLVSNKVEETVPTDRLNIEINLIDPAVTKEFGFSCPTVKLSANQRNRILREDLSFDIRSSHGKNRLYFNIPQLIKACEDNGVEDDSLLEWKKALGYKSENERPASGDEGSHGNDVNPRDTEDE
jgi:hypothetical protein